MSAKDYNSILYARTYIYHRAQWVREEERKISPEYSKYPAFRAYLTVSRPCRYLIAAKTGDLEGAGTDAHVNITLIGSSGRTNARPLIDKKTILDKERGQENHFSFKVILVG